MLERPTLIYKNTKPKKKKFKKNPISIVLDLRSWQKKSIDRKKRWKNNSIQYDNRHGTWELLWWLDEEGLQFLYTGKRIWVLDWLIFNDIIELQFGDPKLPKPNILNYMYSELYGPSHLYIQMSKRW